MNNSKQPEFYCNNCRQYRVATSKSTKYPCCKGCESKIVIADNADKTNGEKAETAKSVSEKLRIRGDNLRLSREISLIDSCVGHLDYE